MQREIKMCHEQEHLLLSLEFELPSQKVRGETMTIDMQNDDGIDFQNGGE